MGVITFTAVLEHGGKSMKDNVQRPDGWDWKPENLSSIILVRAFQQVAVNGDFVELARLDTLGLPDRHSSFDVAKSELGKSYINMGEGRYGVPVEGGQLSAVIANQSMVITDANRSFDFGVDEGAAIVKGNSGHGGKFTVYSPNQFILAG